MILSYMEAQSQNTVFLATRKDPHPHPQILRLFLFLLFKDSLSWSLLRVCHLSYICVVKAPKWTVNQTILYVTILRLNKDRKMDSEAPLD